MVMLRHDAKVKVVVNSPVYGRFSDIVEVGLLDAHLSVLSVTHGMVSGYAGVKPKVTVKVLSGVLAPGELCTCTEKCGG